MFLEIFFPFIALSLTLLALLSGLLVSKRLTRARAERVSGVRRRRWIDAARRHDEVRLRTLARQARRRPRAQEDLLTLLARGELSASGPEGAALTAGVRAGGLDAELRRRLHSRSPVGRGRAAALIGRLALPGALPALASLTSDGDEDVRLAAVQAVESHASGQAAWALLGALRDGSVQPERIVERLGRSWAVAPLLEALPRLDFRDVRGWIAEALGAAGDSRGEPALRRLLQEGNDDDRTRACRALGRLGSAGSTPALVAALEDPFPPVRAQAARALGRRSDERLLPTFVRGLADADWWVRARCAEALRELGPAGMSVLRFCAGRHRDRFARERAAEALALETIRTPARGELAEAA